MGHTYSWQDGVNALSAGNGVHFIRLGSGIPPLVKMGHTSSCQGGMYLFLSRWGIPILVKVGYTSSFQGVVYLFL